jgi:hypothetical protein
LGGTLDGICRIEILQPDRASNRQVAPLSQLCRRSIRGEPNNFGRNLKGRLVREDWTPTVGY